MAAKGAKGGRRRLVVPWWLILAVACFVLGVGVGTKYRGGGAVPEAGEAAEADTAAESPADSDTALAVTDSAPVTGDIPSTRTTWLAWLSPLCLALVATLFLMHRRSRAELQLLRDDLSRLERARRPGTPEGAPHPSHSESTQLRKLVEKMQNEIDAIRRDAEARAGAGGPGALARTEPPGIVPPPVQPVLAPPLARTDVKVLSGILSADDHVRLTSSSRPMLEIRWREGDASAEVWVNPEFKFADLTADLLESAYEVDGGGPGAYETLVPAQVEWSPGASSGRVTRRGRVRALRD